MQAGQRTPGHTPGIGRGTAFVWLALTAKAMSRILCWSVRILCTCGAHLHGVCDRSLDLLRATSAGWELRGNRGITKEEGAVNRPVALYRADRGPGPARSTLPEIHLRAACW